MGRGAFKEREIESSDIRGKGTNGTRQVKCGEWEVGGQGRGRSKESRNQHKDFLKESYERPLLQKL